MKTLQEIIDATGGLKHHAKPTSIPRRAICTTATVFDRFSSNTGFKIALPDSIFTQPVGFVFLIGPVRFRVSGMGKTVTALDDIPASWLVVPSCEDESEQTELLMADGYAEDLA